DSRIHERIDGVAEAEILPGDADASAFQAGAVAELRVISQKLAFAVRGGNVFRIDSCQCSKHDSSIFDSPCHWAGRVLRVRDGNDSRSAHQSKRRLDADDAARGRGTDYGTVRFGADGAGTEIGCHCRP